MKYSFIRILRAAVSLLITGAIAKYQADPTYIAAAPVIQGLGKYLRDKKPDQFGWLPF